MPADWKQAHANAAEHALKHPVVREVMDEYLGNMQARGSALARYGLTKCMSYAAQVARAEALGIDPEALRMTDAEIGEHMRTIIDAAYRAGKPVIGVVAPDAPTRGRPRKAPENDDSGR